ncbi:protein DpdF [Rhodospirillaceae bacterium SYSU D60014]|uniref:protein DpdF n=1 Tax=Virgifigura deserti TaxID=2268457 RepID=UPI000E666AA4
MRLEGDNAFSALKLLVAGETQASWTSPDNPAFDRLRRAWLATSSRSAVELAVLLRQALVHETGRRHGEAASIALGPDSPLQTFADWKTVDLDAQRLGHGWLVSARTWGPSWATGSNIDGLDGSTAAERLRASADTAAPAGDPFLQAVGHTTYQSVGQRAAIRAALTAPPGGTLAVSLATGEGKSLTFQLIAKIGFAGSTFEANPGLTLVVTPTVALAIDHENAALEKGFERPMAYRGDDVENNRSLIARIEDDTLGLCIASPEAVCGPLRRALTESAARGRLRALVIDEAHLIDGWGTGFRTEFQSLSGVRQEWMRAAPAGAAARTLLLSATLTATTLELLRTLFSGPGEFQSLSALRLRAEPDYWTVACASEVERQTRVLEAVRHVPRPAIVYVTRVNDAKAWREQLRQAGFDHVEMVHGETPNTERERILLGWRHGEVDLVVATSAFGLGIDYRHARTVIHACIPESLDRFYQEVGRGGRDGRSCLALTLHTPGDVRVAEKISQTLVISIGRGRQRWRSMFDLRIPTEEPDTYILPLDVAPSQEPEDIDMRGERNSDWNARVLTLMARARLIRLLGSPPSSDERVGTYEQVRVLDLDHLHEATWLRRVEPVRQELGTASSKNLNLMRQFLASQSCPAPLLLDLYSAGPEAHACSRCAGCRADPCLRRPERPRLEPNLPWPAPAPLTGAPRAMLGASGRLIVWYDPTVQDRAFRRRFGELVQALQRAGVSNLVLVQTSEALSAEARRACRDLPVFLAEVRRLTQRRLPAGPELVVLGTGTVLESLDLTPRPVSAEQILLLPEKIDDPSRPGVALISTYSGRNQSFEAFFKRVCA